MSQLTLFALEPSDSQLMTTVEYDMDEQGELILQNTQTVCCQLSRACVCVDEVWLRMLNNERKKESLGEISADLFESIMDRLEKMWFDLVCKCSFFFYCY